ncbi:fibrinogen-like protein A [Apostichopus japonicus]|uniref:fibrinogen-like protein A n=1 Tax=Stichopus japonicus TaxID=307972 RepID=UPI003AB40C97
MAFHRVFVYVLGILLIHNASCECQQQRRNVKMTEDGDLTVSTGSDYPRDCSEVRDYLMKFSSRFYTMKSGVYLIQPDDALEPFRVFCNNSIDGGGWTVIQRRVDGSVDFFRKWYDYKHGFGFLNGEFWLGNDKISLLTNQKKYEIRIDMNNQHGVPYFAKYDRFRISDESSKYRLVELGQHLPESTCADSFAIHRNMSFTTYDNDNDNDLSGPCALSQGSAWWYNRCDECDLNSRYFFRSGDWWDACIEWTDLPGGNCNLKFTEMKVRPL